MDLLYVNLGKEEVAATLEIKKSKNKSSKQKWSAHVPQIGEVLTFSEKDGIISNLNFNENQSITTDKAVLIERIQQIIQEARQEENDGFDSENAQEEVINSKKPYTPDDIKVRRDQYSIREISYMIKDGQLDLQPDFQRHFVWNNHQKSRLIESILLGIPLPIFYFAEEKGGEKFYVIDGLQRLNTIKQFLENEFALKNLEHLGSDCHGKYYENLGHVYKKRLLIAQLSVNVIEAASTPDVKYDIFRRINVGGKPLNNQEMRNSLSKLHTRVFLQKLIHFQEFKAAMDTPDIQLSDIRMGAQELVLRYIGFYLETQNKITYTGDMKDFLDNTNERINEMKPPELDNIEKIFLQAIQNCYHLFGRYCFRKYLPEQLNEERKRLLNRALFITWMITMSSYKIEEVKEVIPFESFAKILAEKLQSDTTYASYLSSSTQDVKKLNYTMTVAKELIVQNLKK